MTTESPTIALIETHPSLPGLLPFQAWDAFARAKAVFVRDPQTHPSAQLLWFAGIDLVQVEPAALERADLDLTRPGNPDQRRFSKALIAAAQRDGVVAFVMEPDDAALSRIVGMEAARAGIDVEFVFLVPSPRGADVIMLAEVMRRLRDPEDGCPWDLEQDHTTLKRHLLEEVYELVDAIDGGDDDHIQEELGDVLMQIVFHAQVADERDAFDLDAVARGITEKLTRRHPHVFADATASTADEVQEQWDELKAQEKQRTSIFDGVAKAQPALSLLQTYQRKAAKAGHDIAPDDLQAAAAVLSDAVRDGASSSVVEDRLGAAVEALVALGREHDIDVEDLVRRRATALRSRVEGHGATAT